MAMPIRSISSRSSFSRSIFCRSVSRRRDVALLLAAFAANGCQQPPPPGPATPWRILFDGRELGAFTSSRFGGDGPITIVDGAIQLDIGSPLTGVTWTGDAPTGDRPYELELTATRVSGTDFFCGLTFPVRDAHLTLILGGWGGALCGLSSLDGDDAARNDTRTLHRFENGRPYRVHLAVSPERVTVQLDGKPLLAADVAGRELSLRPEVELSTPLGIAAFTTVAQLRDIRWRPL